MAEPGQHSADLAILSLRENHLHHGCLALLPHDADALGPDFPLCEPDALGQLIKDFATGFSRDDHSIDFFDTKLGVCKLIRQFTVVGQQEQTCTLLIKPAHRIDPLWDLGQEVNDPRLSRWIIVGRNVALGFVNREVNQAFALDPLTVHFHLGLLGIDSRPQFADDLAVDCDTPLRDELLTRTARSDTGMREDFLEPFRPFRFPRNGTRREAFTLLRATLGTPGTTWIRSSARGLPFAGRGATIRH